MRISEGNLNPGAGAAPQLVSLTVTSDLLGLGGTRAWLCSLSFLPRPPPSGHLGIWAPGLRGRTGSAVLVLAFAAGASCKTSTFYPSAGQTVPRACPFLPPRVCLSLSGENLLTQGNTNVPNVPPSCSLGALSTWSVHIQRISRLLVSRLLSESLTSSSNVPSESIS